MGQRRWPWDKVDGQLTETGQKFRNQSSIDKSGQFEQLAHRLHILYRLYSFYYITYGSL